MAHPDLDRLLDFLIPFAQKMLQKNGAFLPFAASIKVDGELNPLAYMPDTDSPNATELIEKHGEILRHLAATGEIQAGAICYDGRVSVGGAAKQDAITVLLEHTNEEAVTIYLPYKKRLLRGYEFGEIIANEATRQFFV
jgi:hypothetical protein